MAIFLAISGASSTGKTSLIDNLSTHKELSHIIFSPDFHTTTWNKLQEDNGFSEFTDITSDSYYLCTYLHKLVDTYNDYISAYKDYEGIVLLDGCYIDLMIYAGLQMWYNHVIKPAQEEVFSKIMKFSDNISRVYITKVADHKYPIDKYRIRGKMTSFQLNRPLEINLYRIASKLGCALSLTTSDVSGDSIIIIDDMKKLGYLS